MLGLIGEIRLHRDHGVAPRIARSTRHLTTQRVERACVANVGARSQDREREHFAVGLESLRRRVGAAVVEDEDLVLARIALKHLPYSPQQKPDRGRFVVGGNAEIQHRGLRRCES